MNTKKRKRLEVMIDRGLEELARGIGHTAAGEEVWVQGALPNEKRNVAIVHRSKAGRYFGRTSEVLSASEDRVPIPCDHFMYCGGCDFLHANLQAQHAFKRQLVATALKRPLDEVDDVVSSPAEFQYRALAKFVVGPGGVLGSYRPRSHDIVDMQACLIHAPVIEELADMLRAEITDDLQLRYVIMRASLEQSKVLVTLVVQCDVGKRLNALVDKLSARKEVAQIIININDLEGDALLAQDRSTILYDGPSLDENVGGLSQKLLAGAFSQVNPGAAASLYETVVKLAAPQGLRALDLYCASGGISRALFEAGASAVHGVEASTDAVKAAKSSSDSERLSFEAASVEDVLGSLEQYELIVVNPPRKGLSRQVVQALGALAKLRLVYVSCNPKSLARDIRDLQGMMDIEIKRISPVDMFPQTRHVETVVSLESLDSP